MNEIKMSRVFNEAVKGDNVRILLGTRKVENDKISIDIVNANLENATDENVFLSVTHKVSDNKPATFQCKFPKSAFYIERYDGVNGRVDCQIRDGYEPTPHQEKWLEKNIDWSILNG